MAAPDLGASPPATTPPVVGDNPVTGFARVGRAVVTAWAPVGGLITAVIDRFDAIQQRHPATAVPVAVVRKYSDDGGGRLAGQIAYSSLMSVFPLLLVLLTGLGVVLQGDTHLQDEIVNSAVRQFPVVGSDITNNVHQLSTGNAFGLCVGLVWLLYGAQRLSRSAQVMMATVWGVERDDLPGFWPWLPRAAGFLAVLGIGFIGSGALAGLGAFGGLGGYSVWIGLVASFGVNIAMYWTAFRILLKVPPQHRVFWPGALLAGSVWTILQFTGAQLVAHQLKHLSALYGTFATVLGLMWWLALGATVSVYGAEFNLVVTRKLWPRSLRRAPRPVASEAPIGQLGEATDRPASPAA
ncbi:MAG TPA: YihY/virulence factor BrkB family protein [Acidimicrobiales bacterium]|nr:YihY/virulence factor BrkB family protein [Acidimicrobiales bacterium]